MGVYRPALYCHNSALERIVWLRENADASLAGDIAQQQPHFVLDAAFLLASCRH